MPMLPPLIHPMQEFGPCLKEILSAHRVSASELARVMSFRSRNSIFRILEGEGTHGTRQAFMERLIEEDPLQLSQEEKARLTQALEISRVGITGFTGNRAMHELLAGPSHEDCTDTLIIEPASGRRIKGKDIVESYRSWQTLELLITGCCDRVLFELLARYLSGGNMAGKVRIAHIVSTAESEVVRNISAIQPLLYEEFYHAYAVEPGVFSREKEQFYGSNRIFAFWRDEEGKAHNQTFLIVDKRRFCTMGRQRSGSLKAFRVLLNEDIKQMRPIKSVFPRSNSVEAYIGYTEFCRHIEHGRAVYAIKPDIPLSFVPPDIAKAAFVDGVKKAGYAMEFCTDSALEKLYEIQTMRFENFFGKRKPTHFVFSADAMERFARTGRQSDHFFLLREYTPQERVQILTNLRDQMKDNPHFNGYLLKPGFSLSGMESVLFEGVGTLLAKPDSDYHLDDHAEALLTQEEFCLRYKQFFDGYLLERGVYPQQEALDILDRLIGIAQSM